MSTEERKAMIRRVMDEVLNKGNIAVVDEIMAPDYVFHAADGTQINGLEAFKQFVSMICGAFPDIHYNVDDAACDGDIVAIRTNFTGTNTGSLRGMPPTGKKVTMQEALFYRFEGNKSVEEWQFMNQLTLLQQLGIIPPAPRSGG